MTKLLGFCALAALLACHHGPQNVNPEEARTDVAPASDLATSLEVRVGRDSVRFVLHVTNTARQAVRLEFPTGQRYDFVVQTRGGTKVWQWSDGQMFNQLVGDETLAPGASRDFADAWQPAGRTGTFTAIGWLTAKNRRVEQRANFEIR